MSRSLTAEQVKPRKGMIRRIKALIARYDAEGRGCEFHIDHIRNIPSEIEDIKNAANHVAEAWESGDLAAAVTELLGLIETL
jgi:ssDNA-binding replication factor A large subunit